jgi:hypothetical protein
MPPKTAQSASGRAAKGMGDASRARGRRPSGHPWTKATVVLLDRQIMFLDRLCADIRAGSGGSVSRVHIIRALVDALAASDLDLTSARGEADLKAAVRQRLTSRMP